jgi:hypothetical protein
MSLAAVATSKTVLYTILEFLIPLLLPRALDRDDACHAALELLSDHHPATREEVRLAAEIIAFGMQALSALRDATAPGIPISRVMRLRSSACALRRSEHAAQRQLDALQRAHQAAEPTQERAIAAALKNASAYFAGAYTKAREMGDAESAELQAASPPAMPEHPAANPQIHSVKCPAPASGSRSPSPLSPSAPAPHAPASGSPASGSASPRAPAPHAPSPGSPSFGSPASGSPAPNDASLRTPDPHTPARHPQAARPIPPHVLYPQAARPTPAHAASAMPPLRGRIDAALLRMNEELSQIGPDPSDTKESAADFLAALGNALFNGAPEAPIAPAA